jgi:hypothetical protein
LIKVWFFILKMMLIGKDFMHHFSKLIKSEFLEQQTCGC